MGVHYIHSSPPSTTDTSEIALHGLHDTPAGGLLLFTGGISSSQTSMGYAYIDNLSAGVTVVAGALPGGGIQQIIYRSMDFGLNTLRVRYYIGGTTYFEAFNPATMLFEVTGQTTAPIWRDNPWGILLPDIFSCSP